eukprot:TRINITY_DN5760_c0_g2_i1.p1 TRINITY_DN5760_c0_g2~~TRINITY_DN5760_c0_g2_i1.p1  ORF type:complete len:437 (+),score=51.99 TRINITY_DN5760_c0_g2_i1:12-1322(+)
MSGNKQVKSTRSFTLVFVSSSLVREICCLLIMQIVSTLSLNRLVAPKAVLGQRITQQRCHATAYLKSSLPLGSRINTCVVKAAAASAEDAEADPQLDPLEKTASVIFGKKLAPSIVTLGFIALWYALNVGFNLQNKSLFNYFPYPWFVSTVHVVVGAAYCIVTYLIGLRNLSFGRPLTGDEFKKILGPATMHALGHVAANLSFAAVAISLTHTVKTLEPAFNVVLSKLILGQGTPLPVAATLLPIMFGVAFASAAELSFNWIGFISAMISNLTFGFRAVWSKKAMADIKDLSSTAIYAYTTLISVFICAPGIYFFEGKTLKAGMDAAITKVGAQTFYTSLLMVGLLYHLYNQFAFNTLQRVSPVSHGVCNVVKRVVIIATSVIFFGNTLTMQTKIGTAVAIFGTYLYTQAQQAHKQKHASLKPANDSQPPPAPASS